MDNFKKNSFNLYQDIQSRTGGEIYLGIVGPVRTGKSTFIKRFMDLCVIPGMTNEHSKKRTMDELPQSAAGKTIMTTEPKFIPNEAAAITVMDDVEFKIRLIDCVGFMVDGASGHMENDKERMVKTPWFSEAIAFTRAAEIGTEKVIRDHSTIGIVITTDGSFGEIPRENFEKAEERTINELKMLGKPYVIVLNSQSPYSDNAKATAKLLNEKYKVSVIPVNCQQLKKEDVDEILENVLYEFPISQMEFFMPQWVNLLPKEHWLKENIIDNARDVLMSYSSIKDIKTVPIKTESDYIDDIKINSINMADGTVKMDVDVCSQYYYDIISELTQTTIRNEYELINTIKELSLKKNEFEKVASAMSDVAINGYGVVTPSKEDIILDKPEVIKNGSKFGVKIKAQAPAVNMLKTSINVEIAPIVGTEQQANDLIEYINQNSGDNTGGIWNTNIFGKTIEQIVDDGINEKTRNITQESMTKISDTLEKVMNENTGLVCLMI